MLALPVLVAVLSGLLGSVISDSYHDHSTCDRSENQNLRRGIFPYRSNTSVLRRSHRHQLSSRYCRYDKILPRNTPRSDSPITNTRSTRSYGPARNWYTDPRDKEPSSSRSSSTSKKTHKSTSSSRQTKLLKSSQSSRRKPNPLKRLPGAPRKLSPTQALKRPTKRGRPRGKGKERDKSRPPNKRQPKAKRDAKNQVFERLNLPGHGYVPGARNIYELGSVFEQIDKSAEKQSSGKDKISEQGQAILDQDRKGRNDHERPLHLFSTRPTEPRSSRSRKSNKSTKGDSEYAKAIQGSRLIQSPQRNKYLKHGQDPRRGQGSKLDLIVDDTQRPKQRKLAKHSQKSKQKQQDYGGIPNYLRFQSDLHIQSPVQFQQNVEVQGHLHVNAPARFEQKAQVQGPMYINAPTEFLRGTQVKGPVQFNAPTLFRSPPKQAPPE